MSEGDVLSQQEKDERLNAVTRGPLILFAPGAPPCVLDPHRHGRWTLCGRDVSRDRGREITSAQALVWCNDLRCHGCAPLWHNTQAVRLSGTKR